MEYCSGGELFGRLAENGYLNESESAKIMKKLFSALKYLHERGISHRDLKPENFLFSHRGQDAEIKIIDFGLSKRNNNEFSDGTILKTVVGTPLYVAPEVLKRKYDVRCDNWSMGVILYIMLCGNPPFYADNNRDVFQKVLSGKFEMKGSTWQKISFEGEV